MPLGSRVLSVVSGGRGSCSIGRKYVGTLSNKGMCTALLRSYCPTLHRSSCAIHCMMHKFGMRRTGRVVEAHPRRLDLRRVFLITRACRGKDGRFGRIFSITIHVFPSSPATGVGTTTVRLRQNSLRRSIHCLSGTSTRTDTALGGENILGLLRKSLSSTRDCFGRTRTGNSIRTNTGLRRVIGGHGSSTVFKGWSV